MAIFMKILQVVLALSLLVLVHEFGHYFFARLFKIKVEKFYLFFDAGFALFRWKPKKSDTEYGIGWLPLGGYCKIAGMIDESMDKEQMKSEPQPWEFRSHPAWQRFFVLFGGVFFNVILAVVLYTCIMASWGEEYIKNSDVDTGIATNSLGREIGFRNADKVLGFDGNPVEKFDELRLQLIQDQARTATVERGGESKEISIDPIYMPAILESADLFEYGIPFVVAEVPDTSINASAGLMKGDRLLALNIPAQDSTGKDTTLLSEGRTLMFTEVLEFISAHPGRQAMATVQRDADSLQLLQIPLQISPEGLFGVVVDTDLSKFYKVTEKNYTFLEAIPAGIKKAGEQISNYWKQLKLIFTPKTKAYKSVGSFIAIGQIFPGFWNWRAFWSITAFLSIMLAVLNILPIPALDGGHILFTLYEMITGRKPSDKFLIAAQTVGMILLIGLMILAFGNDIFRLLK
ncbi:MAG: RIP metalloprotease RseP [Bacteroidales bacterium]|nr:RIP metalloprotease RseP [Bacteroidales bacterium]